MSETPFANQLLASSVAFAATAGTSSIAKSTPPQQSQASLFLRCHRPLPSFRAACRSLSHKDAAAFPGLQAIPFQAPREKTRAAWGGDPFSSAMRPMQHGKANRLLSTLPTAKQESMILPNPYKLTHLLSL